MALKWVTYILFFVFLESSSALLGSCPYHLPNTTLPRFFNARLTVDPERDQFEGVCTLLIQPLDMTDIIVLHANAIDIHSIDVRDASEQSSDIYKNHTLAEDDTNFLYIQLESSLNATKLYSISINYTGYYGSLDGLYRGSYVENGSREYTVSSQLAAVSARKVFPCYDEPRIKVPFKFTVRAPKDYGILSNMPHEYNEDISDGFHEAIFGETPIMSTYVLGFAVTKFLNKSMSTNGKTIAVHTRRDLLGDADFSLNHSRKSLEALEVYLDFPYRMPKMDIVAVPDFKFNAMENWGMIVYKEEMLTHNINHTPSSLYQKIATVISHENAHMWFGNEVTHDWWGYVWLKEGFATFFEHFITEQIFNGEWRLMEQFAVEALQMAMQMDSVINASPMSSNVNAPDEIMANYDALAYQRGASIIRMMFHILGEDTFKIGIRNYLKERSLKTATPEHLFEHLQSATNGTETLPDGLTIPMIYSTWSNQPSFPLILARRVNQTSIEIKQSRYFRNDSMSSTEEWWVPLRVVTSSKVDFDSTSAQSWLEPGEIGQIGLENSDQWFLLNPQQTGYYRIIYDDDNWLNLSRFLESTNHVLIHPTNKAQLIDDSFELAKAGKMHYNITLNLISYLNRELDYIPWSSARRGIAYLKRTMAESDQVEKLNMFLRTIVSRFYGSVRFNWNTTTDSHMTRRTRELAVSLACQAQLQSCLNSVDNASYTHFIYYRGDIDPDLRATVYCHGLRVGHVTFEAMWSRYLREDRASEKSILLDIMGCATTEENKLKYLNKSIEDKYEIRDHDRHRVLNSVTNSGKMGCSMTLEFLLENFSELQKMAKSSSGIVTVINTLADQISNEEQIEKFSEFIQKYRDRFDAGQRRAVERATETIGLTKWWKTFLMKDVEIWLSTFV